MVNNSLGKDVVYMLASVEGYEFIVFTRNDLSSWVEAHALLKADSLSVATFIYQDIICCHGGRSENLGLTKTLLERYRIKNVHISAYHPQSNGLVERGHGPVVNALTKYAHDENVNWPRYLSLALWADRISIRRSTGYSAFELLYGRDCLLPVDLDLLSWRMVNFIKDRNLIRARVRQLDQRALSEARAASDLELSRKGNKSYFDDVKRQRPDHRQLRVGDLVLPSINTRSDSAPVGSSSWSIIGSGRTGSGKCLLLGTVVWKSWMVHSQLRVLQGIV